MVRSEETAVVMYSPDARHVGSQVNHRGLLWLVKTTTTTNNSCRYDTSLRLLACYKSSLTGFLTCLPLGVSYGAEPLTWDLSGTAAGSFLVHPWVIVGSWPSPKAGTGLLINVSPEGGCGAVSVSGVSDSCSGSGCWSAPLITCMWFWTIGSQGHPVASDSTTACI